MANEIKKLTGEDLPIIINRLTPSKWRQFIVRQVCDPSSSADALRKLWVAIYRGDLKFGVMNQRLCGLKSKGEAREKNLPRENDRNSWICRAIRNGIRKTHKVTK